MTETTTMSTCPMATTCSCMMGKAGSRLWTTIPGILFVALGVLIMFYPQVLAWLVAITLVVMGIAMLVMPGYMHRIGNRTQ